MTRLKMLDYTYAREEFTELKTDLTCDQ